MKKLILTFIAVCGCLLLTGCFGATASLICCKVLEDQIEVDAAILSSAEFYKDKDFIYTRAVDGEGFEFSSAEIKAILDGVPLSEPSVMSWVEGYINEQTAQLSKN